MACTICASRWEELCRSHYVEWQHCFECATPSLSVHSPYLLAVTAFATAECHLRTRGTREDSVLILVAAKNLMWWHADELSVVLCIINGYVEQRSRVLIWINECVGQVKLCVRRVDECYLIMLMDYIRQEVSFANKNKYIYLRSLMYFGFDFSQGHLKREKISPQGRIRST